MNPQLVDFFSGGGGTSVGAARAGYDVVTAINHWPCAIEHHARRHPRTAHICQDVHTIDFRQLVRTPVQWFSPSCQGHSEAAQPQRAADESLANAHDYLRTSAWVVPPAVLAGRPTAFVVENVKEFREWTYPPQTLASFATERLADLEATSRADTLGPEHVRVVRAKEGWEVQRLFPKGQLYAHWLRTLEDAGYHMTEQILRASRWGVPQRRDRLFVVGHRDRPLQICEPKVRPQDEPTIESIIDFEAGEWLTPEQIPDRFALARERVLYALAKFPGQRCWGYHVSGAAAHARSLAQPSTTITTQNQHYAVDGARRRYRLWRVEEVAQVMDFDADYFDGVARTNAIIMAGNAVPPGVAKGILEQVKATL